MSKQMVPVSQRALLQRINRALAKDEEMVKRLRGEKWEHEMGRYFKVDFNRNFVLEKHVDLEATAKELGVIKPWEKMAED